MVRLCLLFFVLFPGLLLAEASSFFISERGDYVYNTSYVAQYLKKAGVSYVDYIGTEDQTYKWNSKTNEFQIKDWFLQDWDSLQGKFAFDQEKYIEAKNARTFNEAKRSEYSGYKFLKKSFSHQRTIPTLKEWGGLTHPPLKRLDLPLEQYDSRYRTLDYKTLDSPFFDSSLQSKIDQLSDSELSFGNIIKPITDFESFQKKKELIQEARKSIFLSSLAFVCDSSTKEIITLLKKKRKEGVRIFVLTDGFISKVLGHEECPNLLKNAGINVILTKDFFKYQGKSIYHTKVLVVDLNVAIAGGQNMIDADHLSRGTDFKNRDVDLFFKGPIVLDIAKGFIENWEHQLRFVKNDVSLSGTGSYIQKKMEEQRFLGKRGNSHYATILNDSSLRMKGVCRFINQAPYRNGHSITKVYLELLQKTQSHLVITDPIKTDTVYSNILKRPSIDLFDRFEYFNLLHQKVMELSESKVKIDYITTNIRMAGNENVAIQNEKIKTYLESGRELNANISLFNLNLSNWYFGKPHYKNLLKDWHPKKNVHVWNHISLMHSKVFYFDRIVASVGSFNFHHNATDHAYESTAVCMDEDLNQDLDKILVLDMANSIPLIFSSVQ